MNDKMVINMSDVSVPLFESNISNISVECDFMDKDPFVIDISGGCSTLKMLEEVLIDEIMKFCKFLPHRELVLTARIDNSQSTPKATVLVRPVPSSA